MNSDKLVAENRYVKGMGYGVMYGTDKTKHVQVLVTRCRRLFC